VRLYEDRAYGSAPIANSYWPTTTTTPGFTALQAELICDTAIIGGGYTGLNAALDLARGGQDVAVLEAEYIGWGASGRNGGFCCLGGSKTSFSTLTRRYGRTETAKYLHTEREAVSFVADRLTDLGIDADTHSHGETCLAHSPGAVQRLRENQTAFRDLYGIESEFTPKEELAAHGLNSPEFYGALTARIGFALNPMKYISGLASAATNAGVRIFTQSAVTKIDQSADGRHLLRTATGQIRAKNLIIATNGYSSETLPTWIAGRYLPLPSAIMVTRPVTGAERAAQGWTSRQMCYDSRNMLHYFRLLPDNRMLFGLRSATRVTPETDATAQTRARSDFDRLFPAWRHVESDYYWSGLICVARNLTPFAGPVPGIDRTWAALCYHGNGVAMGSYSGALIAAQILHRGPATPAVMTRPLRSFELGRMRRSVMPLVYAWYEFRDRIG
jgi:glycine/D-amino acid oxidase-like deaminating enzyme